MKSWLVFFSHLVREVLPTVSRSHGKMHLDIWNTNIISWVVYNDDSDPILLQRPPETIENRLCFDGFGLFSPSWDRCWPLISLPGPPWCTGLWCRDLHSHPTETSTTISVFFNLTWCLTRKGPTYQPGNIFLSCRW